MFLYTLCLKQERETRELYTWVVSEARDSSGILDDLKGAIENYLDGPVKRQVQISRYAGTLAKEHSEVFTEWVLSRDHELFNGALVVYVKKVDSI